jgi:hypothetical protein
VVAREESVISLLRGDTLLCMEIKKVILYCVEIKKTENERKGRMSKKRVPKIREKGTGHSRGTGHFRKTVKEQKRIVTNPSD